MSPTLASLPRAKMENLTVSAAPFDSSTDADIVLRTSDNILLFTQRSFLTYASPFFSHILSDGHPEETYEGCTVCPVVEAHTTMRAILLLCTPIDPKTDDILSALYNRGLSEALEKYVMDRPRARLVSLFHTVAQHSLKTEPMRAFALARLFKTEFGNLAREAALQILKYPLASWPNIPELKLITGRDYQCLVAYFLECAVAAASVLSAWLDREDGKGNQCSLQCSNSGRSSIRCDLLKRPARPWHMLHIRDSTKGAFVKDARILLSNKPGADIEPELRCFLYEASGGACDGKAVEKRSIVDYMANEVAERVKAAIAKVRLALD